MESTSTQALILVVDDHEANRALAQEILEDEGHRVLLASGGAEGLTLFSEHQPDCIVLDVRMPGVDGLEVCARLRELPGGTETPVIFLTAMRDLDTFDRALRAGGDDFLTKPVRPSELALRVEAALRLRRIRSERGELYAMLRAQRDELMRVALQKERLTAFLVHDLKNPVSGIQLAADLILRDASVSPRVRETAALIRTSAGNVVRMLLDLLDISRADEGRLTVSLSDVDLAAVVREVGESLGPRALASAVTINTKLEVAHVRADRELLRRVLENLVENAVRHSGAGTTVVVESQADGASVIVRVVDSGRGVPEALRERIFDRFVQAESGVKALGGRGLGLTFCKLVVEAHDGAIWVEARDPGAAFCVRLPLASARGAPADSASANAPADEAH